MALLSQSDITHYRVDEHGDLTLRDGAPPDAMRAVAALKKKIVHTEAGISYEVEFKLWNKPVTLRMTGEHLGLLNGASQDLPEIHLHVHEARGRLGERLAHLARRYVEDATNGA